MWRKGRARGGSPVSDDGRGLKQEEQQQEPVAIDGSPVSDDGRGLKPVTGVIGAAAIEVRPSVMTGVD